MKKTLIIAAVAALSFAACSPKAPKVAGINYEYMDTTARPGDNFARYSSGHWLDYNPQPKEYSSWGVTTKVYDDNVKALNEIFAELAAGTFKKGSIEQKIGDLYNLVMDSTRRNTEGIAPLKPYLERIRAINSREELIALCESEHDDLFFSVFVYTDDKDSDKNIVQVHQSGLSMNNNDYYTATDPQSIAVVNATKKYMSTLYTLVGYPQEVADKKVARIWEIETELAKSHYTKEQLRDVEANYHKMTVAQASELCNGFDWDSYLKANRYDKTTEINICQDTPVAKGCELLMTLPLEDLKDIYELDLIRNCGGLLSDDFTDAAFEKSKVITGVQEQAPRWKRAQGFVNSLMSEAVGQIFVKKYFSKEAKAEMTELVSNLQASLAQRIQAQEWMCDSTKTKALDKLSSFIVKIGYPDKWEDLSGLEIDPSLSLLENARNATKFYWNLEYEKRYNKPVDKSEWLMSPQTVNAYYNPTSNEICFPAGFLQPPLFDVNSDAASNYGAVGVVIGHEMTHGFDDQGRLNTKDGNMENWWSESDAEGFKKPCDAMTEYTNGLWVIPGQLKANGALTLGECLADHGGLSVSYNAFQMWQDKHGRLGDDNGFTPEQRFFLSYGRMWANTMSPEFLAYLTMVDEHPASFLRVNGGLAQFTPWYEAFNIQPGDSLYVAPENRVNIW